MFCFAFVCKLCVGGVSNYIVQPFHNPSSAIPNCGLAESCIGGCDFSKAKPLHSRPEGEFLLSHTRLPTLCEGILYQKHERSRTFLVEEGHGLYPAWSWTRSGGQDWVPAALKSPAPKAPSPLVASLYLLLCKDVSSMPGLCLYDTRSANMYPVTVLRREWSCLLPMYPCTIVPLQTWPVVDNKLLNLCGPRARLGGPWGGSWGPTPHSRCGSPQLKKTNDKLPRSPVTTAFGRASCNKTLDYPDHPLGCLCSCLRSC